MRQAIINYVVILNKRLVMTNVVRSERFAQMAFAERQNVIPKVLPQKNAPVQIAIVISEKIVAERGVAQTD